ncbi:MAG TPA: bifunctional riboflavin kinase/FAD synthetase [Lacibacter sp.]|nr:bifunctional riboflavin kinase/FAD synthetase [Lacibacter sp.]HMO90303.1 bifunctional riboflavin kinase/FAD synthetase [Lacibacter sp.]HMP85785.1 bifunctional riboflavin kinase/FAD synthetase [Lacibacter sp.]
MKVYRNPDALPAFPQAVVTIGTFDGVHLGHQQIIRQVLEQTRSCGGESVLITFNPHPRKVVNPALNLKELTTLEERIILLRKYGVHNLVVVPFTPAFAALSAEQYIRDFLVARFHPCTIIIGYDHKFGNRREGDFRLLEKYASELGYQVQEIDEQLINDSIISSTKIREALLAGRVDTATAYLGHPYSFKGYIIVGNQLGRTIGYPTANLQINDPGKLIPGNGVYTVTAQLEGENRLLKGMMNIGVRPTVDGSRHVIEVHLFDFDEDIYGRHLTVWLHHFIRSEQKFSGIGELKTQLNHDAVTAQQLLHHFSQ